MKRRAEGDPLRKASSFSPFGGFHLHGGSRARELSTRRTSASERCWHQRTTTPPVKPSARREMPSQVPSSNAVSSGARGARHHRRVPGHAGAVFASAPSRPPPNKKGRAAGVCEQVSGAAWRVQLHVGGWRPTGGATRLGVWTPPASPVPRRVALFPSLCFKG